MAKEKNDVWRGFKFALGFILFIAILFYLFRPSLVIGPVDTAGNLVVPKEVKDSIVYSTIPLVAEEQVSKDAINENFLDIEAEKEITQKEKYDYTKDLIIKNTKIISETPNKELFEMLDAEPITNYYLIGEICNIGEKDLEGHGLVSDISLYEDEDLVTTLMVIQNPSYTTLRKDSCKPFKHPLDKKYKYDKIKGNPYFFNILEDKD